jgi:hypothetical protein
MKQKDMVNFWTGFLVTAVAAAWLYWLWQQRRDVTPQPLFFTGKKMMSPAKDGPA